MDRTTRRWLAALATTIVAVGGMIVPAGADPGDGGGHGVGATNDGEKVTGTATHTDGGSNSSGSKGSGEPNCTQADGTRAYYRYEGLKWTTEEQQRTEIRPDEQRPGDYYHTYCGDDYLGLEFYPEGQNIDPTTLAQSVPLSPPSPVVRTNPDAGSHLVNFDAWFWVEEADGGSASATAGPVSVTVSAAPAHMLVDPGDGTTPFECATPGTAYDTSRPAAGQQSDCTHTYTTAGTFTSTVTVVYDVSFSSNVGAGGGLGSIERDGSATLTVHESQAVVTRG